MLRATIFMDHSNVASPILQKEEFREFVIDFRKLRKMMFQEFIPAGAYAFLGVTNHVKPEKKKFMNYLEMSGFTILSRPLIQRSDGSFAQKGLDTFMSLIIDHLIPTFDVAIILSGDADFIVIVEILKNMYKDVQVWSWNESMSPYLFEKVGEENVFYIDSIWEKIRRVRKSYDSLLEIAE